MEHITSRQNPLMAHIRKLLSSKAYRREQGEYVAEGPKLLSEALKWGVAISTAVVAEGAPLPALPPEIRVVEVPADLLESLSDTQTPQGVLFLCALPHTRLPDRLAGSRYLILDGVQDPGNVGTIWRSADAFGADGLILVNACADPFGPKTVRATMGAAFRLPLWECGGGDLKARLTEGKIPLYGTALHRDSKRLGAVPLSPAAVVIGSEGRGMSQALLALCDDTVLIPMRPRCESLNAATAATVVLWEMARENTTVGG